MTIAAQAWQQAKEKLSTLHGYHWAANAEVYGRDGWFKWPNWLWIPR